MLADCCKLAMVFQQVKINHTITLQWFQMLVLVRASPGQEREATPPSVALLMTDLESLVVGTCIMMPLGTLTYLLNRNHNNKVLNRTILTQILP